MRIGCKTRGPGDGVSYRGSHGQTVKVGRSVRQPLVIGIYFLLPTWHVTSGLMPGSYRASQ